MHAFMLNEEHISGIENGLSVHKFIHKRDGFLTTNPVFSRGGDCLR